MNRRNMILVLAICVLLLIGAALIWIYWLFHSSSVNAWIHDWIENPLGLTAIATVGAAIGTVGAVIVALFGIRYERKRAQLDRQEAQKRFQKEQERARDVLKEERDRFERAQAESQKQFEASQKQTQDALDEGRRQFLETQFAGNKPILIPEGALEFQKDKPLLLNLDKKEQQMTILNVGPGVALNVFSVIYGEKLNNTSSDDRITYIRWSSTMDVPIESRMAVKAVHKLGAGFFDQERQQIGSYTLYAPESDVSPMHLARIIITYVDIFKRKHASIFDYVEATGWQLQEFLEDEDIPQDLHDLEFEVFNG